MPDAPAILPCATCPDFSIPGCCECACDRRISTGGCKYLATVAAQGSYNFSYSVDCEGPNYSQNVSDLKINGAVNGSKQLTFKGGSEIISISKNCSSSVYFKSEDCQQDSDCCGDEKLGICTFRETVTGTCGQAQNCNEVPGVFLGLSRTTISPGPTGFEAQLYFKKNKQIEVTSLNISLGGFFIYPFGFFLDPTGSYSLPFNWPDGSTTLKLRCTLSNAPITFSGSITLT